MPEGQRERQICSLQPAPVVHRPGRFLGGFHTTVSTALGIVLGSGPASGNPPSPAAFRSRKRRLLGRPSAGPAGTCAGAGRTVSVLFWSFQRSPVPGSRPTVVCAPPERALRRKRKLIGVSWWSRLGRNPMVRSCPGLQTTVRDPLADPLRIPWRAGAKVSRREQDLCLLGGAER